ncbi:MAG TPA: hypothetical protein VHW70_10125 [Edaphobacter sp.]|nr:hypothetical protein [Edaphobacter sp.]
MIPSKIRAASGNISSATVHSTTSRHLPFSAIHLSRSLVFIALLAQIIVAWRFWYLTWDDSAITLGFARTFALTGRIEPTPGSGIVEGYSTTLWMLLMAMAAKFAATPSALLVVAKISTLLLNLANILLMRRWFLTWTTETVANLVAGSVGCGLMFYETINGMETPLVLALVLVMLLLFPRPDRASRFCYLLAGSAFLLIRWEAAWLLVPFVLVELNAELNPKINPRRKPNRALLSAATWLTVFLLSNLARWRYFGSLLPNTIIAKRGIPYTASIPSLEIHRHLQDPIFILTSSKIFVIVSIANLLYDRFVLKRPGTLPELFRSSFRDCWQLRFAVLFTVFSLILTAAIGTNWGPPVRSFYPAWPFLFGLLLLPLSQLRTRTLAWATAALCVFALLRMTVHVQELKAWQAPVYMPGTTVSRFETVASVLSDIESASHHEHLVYAGPDMGAVMLFTHGVQVIDLGLLCDRFLARTRYTAINSYVLEQRQPDVIEVHENWTQLANLEAYPLFFQRYRPVYVHGIRTFLDRSLIESIDPSRLSEKPFQPDGRPDKSELQQNSLLKYTKDDFRLNKDFGTYLILN